MDHQDGPWKIRMLCEVVLKYMLNVLIAIERKTEVSTSHLVKTAH